MKWICGSDAGSTRLSGAAAAQHELYPFREHAVAADMMVQPRKRTARVSALSDPRLQQPILPCHSPPLGPHVSYGYSTGSIWSITPTGTGTRLHETAAAGPGLKPQQIAAGE